MALVYGYADDQKIITPQVVHEVVKYRQKGAINPYKTNQNETQGDKKPLNPSGKPRLRLTRPG